jgi:hypothetical protein
METAKPTEEALDLRWGYGMKWPRGYLERIDFDVTERMIRANSNFYGLKHLQPLREFLEQIAEGG